MGAFLLIAHFHIGRWIWFPYSFQYCSYLRSHYLTRMVMNGLMYAKKFSECSSSSNQPPHIVKWNEVIHINNTFLLVQHIASMATSNNTTIFFHQLFIAMWVWISCVYLRASLIGICNSVCARARNNYTYSTELISGWLWISRQSFKINRVRWKL